MAWKPIAHTAVAGSLLGVGLYVGADTLGDFTTYYLLRSKAVALADVNEALKQQIGFPYTLGPWYNARIGFSSGGSIAMCSFSLQGTAQITDVTVRGIRKPGIPNTFLYNVLGGGQWTLIDCTAMFPSGGGLVKPQSLIPEAERPEGDAGSAGPHAGVQADCEACNTGQVQTAAHAAHGGHGGQHGYAAHGGASQQPEPGQQKRPWWKLWR